MTEYIDVLNNPYLSQQQKIDEINRIGEAERTAIDIENQKAQNRIKRGSALQVASGLPILNIPYVGTGIGGGLYEAGNAIMDGKDAQGILDDAKRGFIIGETVGAIPYVGKYAGKTKVGKAVGNKASNLFSKLMETNAGQKLGDFAKKAEDVLMTDIKAFNPNKQTAYHGSPYDFAKFSNEAIGTGEGAQAHGMGHYVAKSKDVAGGYADRLSNRIENEIKTITYDGVPYEYKYGREILLDPKKPFLADVYANRDDYKTVVNNYLEMYDKNLQQYNDPNYLEFLKAIGDKSDTNKVIENLNNMKNFVKNFDINKLERNTNKQLYKLSIPKDDVMLREELPFSEQSEAVRKAMKNIANTYNDTFDSDMLLQAINKNKKGKQFYRDLEFELGQDWKAAGEELYNSGIKGISYNGGIDGEARVIFNPNDIDIVRKYYNQPSLYEQISGIEPSTGAVSSNLYDLMTREEKIQNLWDKRKIWGTPFQKASGNPTLAIQTLKENRRGFVPNADNNGVDFVWGEYIPPAKPNKKGGGYGLAHIEGRRLEDGFNGTDFLNEIPDLFLYGSKYLKPSHNGRYYIGDGQKEAIIRTDYNGEPWHWLNSTYYLDK